MDRLFLFDNSPCSMISLIPLRDSCGPQPLYSAKGRCELLDKVLSSGTTVHCDDGSALPTGSLESFGNTSFSLEMDC